MPAAPALWPDEIGEDRLSRSASGLLYSGWHQLLPPVAIELYATIATDPRPAALFARSRAWPLHRLSPVDRRRIAWLGRRSQLQSLDLSQECDLSELLVELGLLTLSDGRVGVPWPPPLPEYSLILTKNERDHLDRERWRLLLSGASEQTLEVLAELSDRQILLERLSLTELTQLVGIDRLELLWVLEELPGLVFDEAIVRDDDGDDRPLGLAIDWSRL